MNYISMDSSQDIIEHYGIKGMKWGIRSRHSGLKDRHTQYKKSKKLYSQAIDALGEHPALYGGSRVQLPLFFIFSQKLHTI